jgi:CRP-like cAMP-binding protein
MIAKPMFQMQTSIMSPVLRRLNALGPLTPQHARRVEALGFKSDTIAAGGCVAGPQDGLSRPRFLVGGWACRQRVLPDGRRQIFSLLSPGDSIGLAFSPRPVAMVDVFALTRVTLVSADALLVDPIDEIGPPQPVFADIINRALGLDEALLLDHVVRLGRHTAYERMAHLLLELRWRLSMIGQVDAYRFTMPLTQEILADVLGLSIVHVNRTLQQLRRERLIELAGSQVTLLEPGALIDIADYRPPLEFAAASD